MVTVEEAIIAKIDKAGKHFEVLVDPNIAYELREGKIVSISKMLAVWSIKPSMPLTSVMKKRP